MIGAQVNRKATAVFPMQSKDRNSNQSIGGKSSLKTSDDLKTESNGKTHMSSQNSHPDLVTKQKSPDQSEGGLKTDVDGETDQQYPDQQYTMEPVSKIKTSL